MADPAVDAIGTLLSRYEDEFREAVANPNCPPDSVTELLTAINLLREERTRYISLKSSKVVADILSGNTKS